MEIKVKICGVNSLKAVDSAVEGGASFVGFVFYEPSPRNISHEKAKLLSNRTPNHIDKVGVFVDPSDEELKLVNKSVTLSMIQLHGSESPERVSEVRSLLGLPIIKAVQIEGDKDLRLMEKFKNIADWLLLDAKPNKNSVDSLPGGNALSFDWNILANKSFDFPWILSGGLNEKNIAEAITVTNAKNVDVSSGVEDKPGYKNEKKIRNFLTKAHYPLRKL